MYGHRPLQCRSFPFWAGEPGVGRGLGAAQAAVPRAWAPAACIPGGRSGTGWSAMRCGRFLMKAQVLGRARLHPHAAQLRGHPAPHRRGADATAPADFSEHGKPGSLPGRAAPLAVRHRGRQHHLPEHPHRRAAACSSSTRARVSASWAPPWPVPRSASATSTSCSPTSTGTTCRACPSSPRPATRRATGCSSTAPGKACADILEAQMRPPYFPVGMEAMGAEKHYVRLREPPLRLGGAEITWREMKHPGGCIAYKISEGGRSLIFATDSELSTEDFRRSRRERRLLPGRRRADPGLAVHPGGGHREVRLGPHLLQHGGGLRRGVGDPHPVPVPPRAPATTTARSTAS